MVSHEGRDEDRGFMKPSESPSRLGGRVALVILAAALLFSAFVRWRLGEMPLERDEGEYAYAGQLLLQGISRPITRLQYETARDPPGVRRDHGRVWPKRRGHPSGAAVG